jgi:hypothetical protein
MLFPTVFVFLLDSLVFYLGRLGFVDNVHSRFGKLDTLLATLVKRNLLTKNKGSADLLQISYSWGLRAYAEFPDNDIVTFIASFFPQQNDSLLQKIHNSATA